MFFVVGVVLFSSTVLLPQFLQTLMGYTAEAAGLVLSAAVSFACGGPTPGTISGALSPGLRVDHAGVVDEFLAQAP